MAPRYCAYRFFARQTLGDDARFVLCAPGSPSTRPREYFDSPDRLRDSIMLCHHSKPCDPNQTADSQNRCRCERCGRDDAYPLSAARTAVFRGINAAASLKLFCGVLKSLRASRLPRHQCRGLIEARSRRCPSPIGRPRLPRHQCRGLIEATRNGRATSLVQESLPRHQCRGLIEADAVRLDPVEDVRVFRGINAAASLKPADAEDGFVLLVMSFAVSRSCGATGDLRDPV
jgi:hypothetical protein